jgi:ComF family protein
MHLTKNYQTKILGFLAAKLSLTKFCLVCKQEAKLAICPQCEQTLEKPHNPCYGCGINLPDSESNYCGSCLTKPLSFDRVYTLYNYTGLIKPLIYRFKYGKDLSLGKFFAKQISDYYLQHKLDYELIIPLPIHNKRLFKRGFNQAAELSRLINAAQDDKNVVRQKHTLPLSALKPKERIKELSGAFQVKKLRAKKILIIDDILTTATTANELTKTIRKYYKQHKLPNPKIDLLVLARANN